MLSCAASDAIVNATFSAAKGKASGEQTQLRTLARTLEPGDILVGDSINENYWSFALLASIDCDVVFEINGSRLLSRGRRKLVTLARPRRPQWMDRQTYETIPGEIVVRRSVSKKKGYRDKTLLSTFVDIKGVPDEDIAALYARRWGVETDFLYLKHALGAGVLRCTTSAMVRKELHVHLLAYNLIRLLMCEAARSVGREPRTISFRHTVQLWSALALMGIRILGEKARAHLFARIARYEVANRPGRREPRAVKRRPKPRALLNLPREDARPLWWSYERG